VTTIEIPKRWIGGRYRMTRHWTRFLPIHLSRLWIGPCRWRDIRGLGLGFGPFVFYVGRW